MDDEPLETLNADENVAMSCIRAATRAKARLGFLYVRIIFMAIRLIRGIDYLERVGKALASTFQ